jgi:hypothetical protein
VRRIEEENTHLLFEIEAFESPENLLKLSQRPEFAHLRFPMTRDVLTMKQGTPLQGVGEKVIPELKLKPTITFATGAKPQ